jgi:hypothetical protein
VIPVWHGSQRPSGDICDLEFDNSNDEDGGDAERQNDGETFMWTEDASISQGDRPRTVIEICHRGGFGPLPLAAGFLLSRRQSEHCDVLSRRDP